MITLITRDMHHVEANLARKVWAVLADVNGQLPSPWRIVVFETQRSSARQAKLYEEGVSRTLQSKHLLRGGLVHAVDVTFCHDKEGLTWKAPWVLWQGKRVNGWALVDSAKKAHGLRVIPWDKPHCEIKQVAGHYR